MEYAYKGLLLIVVLLITNSVFSQNFSGKVTDKNQQPIPGSTVLIKEANQGIACNNQGAFQTTLKAGVYQVEYRCLGYENFTETIRISPPEKVVRHITLQEKAFELKEVVISNNNKRDRAYAIMQKAIEKAPYHQQLVKEYEADCYIKGDIELIRVNKLVDKMSTVDGFKMSDFQGNLFVQESYSTIHFTSPDKYKQTVTAFSSSVPDNLDPSEAMPLMSSSLYLPRFSGLISPLNPQAFTYYRFRYDGYLEDDGEFINKIRVIPKMKDPMLLEGDIYIADKYWDIRYADLMGSMYGINQHFTITYDQMEEKVYLPTTFSNKMNLSIMGTEGLFNYYTSMKYNRIEINDSLYNAQNKGEKKVKKEKKSLEIKGFGRNYQMKTDSLATKRDSLFWSEVRNTPLSEREIESFVLRDSIQQHMDSVRKKQTDAKFQPIDLLFGGQLGGDSTRFIFKYGGIAGALRDYNYVDGFGLGQKFELSTKVNKISRLTFRPEVYYTTARKQMVWNGELHLNYAPMRLGNIHVFGGDISTDFNETGINRMDDAFSILFWGKNHRMLYRKQYMKIRNEIDIANGLQLTGQLEKARRSPLENNTRYRFWGARKKIKENRQDPLYTDLLAYTIGLKYTPEYYYTMVGKRKWYRHSKYPTFSLLYHEGFSSVHSDNARFRNIQGTINQTVNINLFSSLIYEVGGGTFIGKRRQMNFADYKHMNTAGDFWFVSKNPLQSFMLLDPYVASTNEHWAYTHVNYSSKYIFLKRLPFLQGKMFSESLHLKYLYTPKMKNYTEVGYSVDLFQVLSLGIFSSFDNFKYDRFGVRFTYRVQVFQ